MLVARILATLQTRREAKLTLVSLGTWRKTTSLITHARDALLAEADYASD